MAGVAVAQMRPTPGDVPGNRGRTVRLVERAAAQGADLVVLPELCTTGYAFADAAAMHAQAEPLDGPTATAWAEVAARLGVSVVGGLAELAPEGGFNTAIAVGPSGVAGVYRKAHLFAAEKRLFRVGDSGPVIADLPCARVGLAVCFDLRFIELPRALALAGADLLAVPTTWTDLHKPNPYDERGWCMANVLAQVHAYANRMYVACADRVGGEAGVRYLGASVIFGPGGEALAGPASADAEEVLVAEFDPARARDKSLGADNDLFGDRRPALYDGLGAPPAAAAGLGGR